MPPKKDFAVPGNPGGLSSLYLSRPESSDEKWVVYALTDRGPNGETRRSGDRVERPFFEPEFSPRIYRFVVDRRAGVVESGVAVPFRRADGRPLSGLPNRAGVRQENPVDRFGKQISFDAEGLDPECMVRDDNGDFWLGEEYGPSLVKVARDGRVEKGGNPR
ncbi:MAG: esterase-like activity of phytase family protein [Calothrix sp. SM1_5_4]|nr:esterase-like activity of phytase family protein [Calothrix sp. SM1_5_4]